jgi:hypothetical protein
MVRIEKTQINIGGFITILSTLEKIQSDKVIEIKDEGRSVILRPKEEFEKEDFRINLTRLTELFQKMVSGGARSLLISDEEETYIRNCSYACSYFQKENESYGEFDHFRLFHEIHFTKTEQEYFEKDLMELFCRLFRSPFCG